MAFRSSLFHQILMIGLTEAFIKVIDKAHGKKERYNWSIDDWNALINSAGTAQISKAALKIITWLATVFSRLRMVARCWFDTVTPKTSFLWARTAMNILTWLMIDVRTTNITTVPPQRNFSKSFEAKRTSVATTNSVALTPANTALFIAPVETTKQIEINYNKIKDTEKPWTHSSCMLSYACQLAWTISIRLLIRRALWCYQTREKVLHRESEHREKG